MKLLRIKTSPHNSVPSRRAERRSFVVLILLTVVIWSISTVAVQVL